MTPVNDFYDSRCVLVTGASGFLGKVLVEKLLRSVSNIDTIFVVIRSQKGLDPRQRLDKILESALFDRIRGEQGEERFTKLVPIKGDLMEHELDLNQDDRQQLYDKVSVVFHCAATVKFDEALRISVKMNVVGTQQLVELCHKMPNLVSIVHISTAYANCDRNHIAELVYPASVAPSKLINTIDWMDDSLIASLTPYILGRRPNTYTLTKALAEIQIAEDGQGRLPVIIVRPSIIGSIWREPIPGWTDNLNGPTGIFTAVGKGVLSDMHGDAHSTADIVPVDIVSNLLIVAAWHRAVTNPKQIPVIHCCSGHLNPLEWAQVVELTSVFYRHYPLEQCYQIPITNFHSNYLLYQLGFYARHKVPAHLLDLFARITGRKPKFVRLFLKLRKMIETLHYFTTRSWDFQTKAVVELWDLMSPDDQQVFNFDIRQINWNQYLFRYLLGVRSFIFKEDLANLPIAIKRIHRMKCYTLLANVCSWALLMKFLLPKRARHQKWLVWLLGTVSTHFYLNFNQSSIVLPDVNSIVN